jgi:hypothetical protein
MLAAALCFPVGNERETMQPAIVLERKELGTIASFTPGWDEVVTLGWANTFPFVLKGVG